MSFARLKRAHTVKVGDRVRYVLKDGSGRVWEGEVTEVCNDARMTTMVLDDDEGGSHVVLDRSCRVEILNDRK